LQVLIAVVFDFIEFRVSYMFYVALFLTFGSFFW